MATVFANDPASAFAMSANLDQQRVQNFLNSLAQNRNTQLQGWEAARSMAAARQGQEQQQQNQALQVAQVLANRRQQQQAQQEAQQRTALELMLANRDFGLRKQQQDWLQTQPSAADRRASERATQESEDQAKEDAELARLLPLLNEKRRRDALGAMLAPASIEKLKEKATGAGFEPESRGGWFNWANIFAPNRSTLAKENEIKDRLARESFDLPVEPSGESERLDAYVKRLMEGLATRNAATAGTVPDVSKVAGLVDVDAEGRLVPLRRNPLTTGTGTTPTAVVPAEPAQDTQPSLPSRPYFQTAADVAAAKLKPGTQFMIWDSKKKEFRPAEWY